MKADRTDVERLLKTARGQIDGILKMVDDDRYCMDIVNQVVATTAVLKKVSKQILTSHIKECIKDAFNSDSIDEDNKIDELMKLINKL